MLSIGVLLAKLLVLLYAASYLTVAAHELAHAMAALALGIPVYRVALGRGPALLQAEHLVLRLFPSGGQIDLRDEGPSAAVVIGESQLGVIAAAGPIANFLLASLAAVATWRLSVTSIAWPALAFAALFNILCFFQNALAAQGSDGHLVWNALSVRYCKAPLSDWAQQAINRTGDFAFHLALGAYMGWIVWRAGVLNPWLAGGL